MCRINTLKSKLDILKYISKLTPINYHEKDNPSSSNNQPRGLPEIMHDIIRARALQGCFPDYLIKDKTLHFLFINTFCMLIINLGLLAGGKKNVYDKEPQNSLLNLWEDTKEEVDTTDL